MKLINIKVHNFFIFLFYFYFFVEIKQLRDEQRDLSSTLESKQTNTQKLQQSIDLQDSEIERMMELKQKVCKMYFPLVTNR